MAGHDQLHRGCIPTKALLHAAEVADHARDGAAVGVRSQLTGIDVPAVHSYKDGVVSASPGNPFIRTGS